MTIREERNQNIIRDFKALLGTCRVMEIYYQLSAKYYLDAETIRGIIRRRETRGLCGRWEYGTCKRQLNKPN